MQVLNLFLTFICSGSSKIQFNRWANSIHHLIAMRPIYPGTSTVWLTEPVMPLASFFTLLLCQNMLHNHVVQQHARDQNGDQNKLEAKNRYQLKVCWRSDLFHHNFFLVFTDFANEYVTHEKSSKNPLNFTLWTAKCHISCIIIQSNLNQILNMFYCPINK